MSAVTDALREAIEALDTDAVESEVDELRNALDNARSQMKDTATAIREEIAMLTSAGARIRELRLSPRSARRLAGRAALGMAAADVALVVGRVPDERRLLESIGRSGI
jgi:hypothetical protein